MDENEQERPRRLDQYVVQQIPSISRSSATKLIESGKVSVNGDVQPKGSYRLRTEDSITIDYEVSALPEIPKISLPVIYEDDDCVVINKPIGLLTHSKGDFNPEATVATWLHDHLANEDSQLSSNSDDLNERAGIVHRLDRATSGVMICAKNDRAMSWLQKQFSQRKVKKTYIAVVQGTLSPEHAIIDMPIERNPKRPQTFRVGPNGKPAVTEYQVLKTNDRLSMLELKPTTGRTHQLRVHLLHFGHPIIGDTFYDNKPAERLYLHALSLEITLPNRERKTFSAPLPESFNELFAKNV